VVQVDRKPYEGFAVLNNRGSKFTGAWRAAVNVRRNASTSLGESIGLILGKSEAGEQNFIQLGYSQSIGTEGMTFDAIVSQGKQTPGFTLKALDVKTESLFGRGAITYPWIRSRRKNVFLTAGFDALQSEVETLGVQTSEDQLRVLHGTASTDFVDPSGALSTFSLGIRQGLPILGASPNGTPGRSRPEGVNDFTSLNATAARRQPLIGDLALSLSARGQFSFDTLLSDEECRLGGETFGRGYDPSEIAGEDCLGFTAELQYSGRNPFPPPSTYLSGFQAYAFYDFGVVWNTDTLAEPRTSLASAGVGIRLQILENLFLDFEIANPLTKDVATEGNADPRAFFQALARF
jgi:hemolysin activation/secretion protein